MTEKIHQTLRDSKAARWTALAVVAFTMLCGYFLTDVMAPLKPMLEKELLWTSTDYGIFTSAYGWFNVFLLMLIFGGIILDKMGVRFTGLGACILMVIGCTIKYGAVSGLIPLEGTVIAGMKGQVAIAALGYAIFGVGVEIAGITVSKIIVKWFKGYEMALAMGLEMATARLGTMLAMSVTVPFANFCGSISAPILLCLVMLCIGLIAFFIYTLMDRKLEASIGKDEASADDAFRLSDIMLIVRNKGFWLIALLCVLFYSAVFPFLKYATDLMVNKYEVDPELAGIIPSLLPLGTLFLTPFFGNLYDRHGKGATIMLIGAVMLIGVHALFALPLLNYWWFATIIMIVLGIAFSLVPSAMWPSVPKIIPEKQLGTAYALIFWVQNWGLMGVPALIGWVLDRYCKLGGEGQPAYDYTLPMTIFACFGVLALIIALNSPIVSTKSALPCPLYSCFSFFLAIHGPINTVIVSGSSDLRSLESANIGDIVVDICSASSGYCFLIRFTNAGQHEVVSFFPSLAASSHSSASACAVKSPPRPTSYISLKPNFLQAVRILLIVIVSPNCPSTAGATMATTFFPSTIAFITSTISVLEPIAPNGQACMQCPHLIHLLSSISQIPFSSIVIALAGQIFLHGLIRSAIALYGQALAHMPHSLHLSGSM